MATCHGLRQSNIRAQLHVTSSYNALRGSNQGPYFGAKVLLISFLVNVTASLLIGEFLQVSRRVALLARCQLLRSKESSSRTRIPHASSKRKCMNTKHSLLIISNELNRYCSLIYSRPSRVHRPIWEGLLFLCHQLLFVCLIVHELKKRKIFLM